MATYHIYYWQSPRTRESSTPITRRRVDAVRHHLTRLVWEMAGAQALLDRPVAHEAMAKAHAYASGNLSIRIGTYHARVEVE